MKHAIEILRKELYDNKSVEREIERNCHRCMTGLTNPYIEINKELEKAISILEKE
jgi:uncharacterized protein (UPF0147 family)